MITQIRETQFGQLARLVSNARWLKYPDELDTSIWQKSVPQAGASDLGRKKNRGSSNDDTEQEPGWADDAVNNSNVFIVGWYGPDDIEVLNSEGCVSTFLTSNAESSQLV